MVLFGSLVRKPCARFQVASMTRSPRFEFRAGARAARSLAMWALLILSTSTAPASANTSQTTCSETELQNFRSLKSLARRGVHSGRERPFPAAVDLRPRICEGPVGIPPSWEQSALSAWGYAVLAMDSFAMRGLAPGRVTTSTP